MSKHYQILVRPLVTEKSTLLQEKVNQYQFEVNPKANRQEIKKEIERVFPKVKVLKVCTANYRGKVRRMGRSIGRRSNWKKAIVTLRPDDHIEIFEGA